MDTDTDDYMGRRMQGVTYVVRAGENAENVNSQTAFLRIAAALRFAEYLRTMRKIPFVIIDGVVY